MKANQNPSRPFRRYTPALLFPLLGAVLGTPVAQATEQCCSKWVISCDYTMGQDATYDCVHICSPARLFTNGYKLTVTGAGGLTIEAGAKLYVDNGSGAVVLTGGGTSTVNGRIYLQCSGSEFEVDDASQTLEGSGKIIGENNGAKITIAPGTTLTSAITIEGALEIGGGTTPLAAHLLGAGTFANNGLVEANRANETLTIHDGTIEGSCDGEFKVATSGATLWFRSAVGDIDETNMGCTFTQSAGTFDIDINIDTRGPCSGTFDVTRGSLDCCEGEDPCPGCR
jgi:hypothetical protein